MRIPMLNNFCSWKNLHANFIMVSTLIPVSQAVIQNWWNSKIPAINYEHKSLLMKHRLYNTKMTNNFFKLARCII